MNSAASITSRCGSATRSIVIERRVGVGPNGAITGVCCDVANAEPPALVAVPVTRTVAPTSAVFST